MSGRDAESLERLWQPIVQQGIASGGAHVAGGGDAVAIWVPPGLPEMSSDDEALVEALVLAREPARAAEITELMHRFAVNRGDGLALLTLFATASAARGAGLGMALLRHTLTLVDEAGLPAYLESTNPRNNFRYATVGFAVVGSFAAPNDGPTVTMMWREFRVDS